MLARSQFDAQYSPLYPVNACFYAYLSCYRSCAIRAFAVHAVFLRAVVVHAAIVRAVAIL